MSEKSVISQISDFDLVLASVVCLLITLVKSCSISNDINIGSM